jgi:phosphoribosylformimino-5-aminoimidazole carboxamide ribotide isomerase
MKIIPAIDILDGKVVRLAKGNFNNSKIYSEDPYDYAKRIFESGFNWIHIVDLSGSKNGKISVFQTLEKIISNLKIKIQFGGGIRTLADAQSLIQIGVQKIVIGSISVTNKMEFEKIVKKLSAENIICAADIENNIVKVKGWTERTGQNIYDHINYCLSEEVKNFLCTDIKRDGMLSSPNFELYKELKSNYPDANIIASGGISCISDITKLKSMNIYGVVVGKAIFESKIDLKELSLLAS